MAAAIPSPLIIGDPDAVTWFRVVRTPEPRYKETRYRHHVPISQRNRAPNLDKTSPNLLKAKISPLSFRFRSVSYTHLTLPTNREV